MSASGSFSNSGVLCLKVCKNCSAAEKTKVASFKLKKVSKDSICVNKPLSLAGVLIPE